VLPAMVAVGVLPLRDRVERAAQDAVRDRLPGRVGRGDDRRDAARQRADRGDGHAARAGGSDRGDHRAGQSEPARARATGRGRTLTLPDLLRPGLEVVFVGINPSSYSVARGHYFARRQNRFWPAFSRSRLSGPVRAALGRDQLGPEDDVRLLEHGFGFTDVVKVSSSNASTLRPADYAEWAPRLTERL